MYMEKQTATGKPAAAVSLDWSKFFDSVQRNIGQELVKDMAKNGSGEKVFRAEEKLLGEIRPRFKVGKSVGKNPYEKSNGFMQGPNYSITVTLATLSVWTRMMEDKVRCKTSSFIDDSSVRTNEGLESKEVAEAIQETIKHSEEFGKMTGTKLNKKKVKVLVNDKKTEDFVKQIIPELKQEAYKKATILVGGIVTTGQAQQSLAQRANLQEQKRDKVKDSLTLVERTGASFEKREQLIGTYAITKMTYGCGVNLNTWDQNSRISGRVHNVLANGKTNWKCRAITLTYHARSHLVEPWQAERYTAVRTIRRLMQKRETIKHNFIESWRLFLAKRKRKEEWKAHGPAVLLAKVLKEIHWEMDEELCCTRQSGGKIHLVKGEDGLFDHILRTDLRRAIIERCNPIVDREEFQGIKENGIDYAATVKLSRAKYGKAKSSEKTGTSNPDQKLRTFLSTH